MSTMLGNWPPSRGPNPHTHGWNYEPAAVRKDMPAPKQHRTATVEKETISNFDLDKPLRLAAAKPMVLRRLKERKKRLLAGTWKVWYPVHRVLELTVDQADDLIMACPESSEKRHHEDWWDYEPRPLWVDLTYPLTRGVRLLVKPLVRAAKPCKACGDRDVKQTLMSPGYFLWSVAKEYERIYKEHEKYGIWGHAIEDLGFERITIRKDGVVDLFIGS